VKCIFTEEFLYEVFDAIQPTPCACLVSFEDCFWIS